MMTNGLILIGVTNWSKTR